MGPKGLSCCRSSYSGGYFGVLQMDKKKLLTWMTLGASVMALAIFRKMMKNPGDEYDRGKERPYRPVP